MLKEKKFTAKRILSIVLTLIMAAGIVSGINLHEAAYAYDEQVYEGLKYKTNEDGTMSVTGCIDREIEVLDIPAYIDGKSVAEIDYFALYGLSNLKEVSLPDSIRVIGGYAFDQCYSLSKINIPENVEIIRANAFNGCTSLENITIPESVKEIGDNCFGYCISLEKFTVLNPACSISTEGYGQSDIKNMVVYGNSGSTAEAFADSLNLSFVPLDLPETINVDYRTHVQTYGWETSWKGNGETSGTVGEAKRLEAIEIKLDNQTLSGNIEYCTHIQTYGWETSWKSNGEASGTVGEAKRLEAIKIRLTGKLAEKYDIYYRVHAQTFGWLGWAKNGEPAGTAGYAKRLEAIQILIVYKGSLDGEMDSALSYIDGTVHVTVQYGSHIQNYGWQWYMMDGETSGTVGQGKRLEALKVDLCTNPIIGGLEYRSHIQSYGWEKTWRHEEETSGTVGEGKRLEAVQIRLTGEIAKQYDIYYRVHAQSYGWLGWAKNGQSAGTEGLAKRLEAIQIVVVKKGEKAPGSTANAFIKK